MFHTKFNILSVKVILFQGNQKNISAFRVGIIPILVCLQMNLSDFQTIRGKRNFSSRTDVFLKSQLFSKSTLNLARFDTKFVAVRKISLSALWQASLGSSVYELSLYPALSLSVSQKHQLTMKVRMKYSMDVAMTTNQCSLRKSTSKAHIFKTVTFSIDFIQRS